MTLIFCMVAMYVCVSVSIMAKGLSGKRTVLEGNAGGKSTLRHFQLADKENVNETF